MIRFILLTVLLGFSAVSSASPESMTNIPASDPRFVYTGRVDFSNPAAPVLSWPSTSIKANFTGSSLAITLDDQVGKNFYNVIVDGQDQYPFVIACQPGEVTYQISTSLGDGAHSVEIFKRTEGKEGSTVFKGLTLASGGTLLAPPKRAMRRIEFYGDSITSGAGNEAADNASDKLASEKNSYLSYASFTARALDAEYHMISRSSIGIMASWFDFQMPDYFDQLSAVGDNDSHWNFQQWTPDVVVVNLMQNDSWLVDDARRVKSIPTDAQRIQAYTDFINTVRRQYPNALIVCALGSMDAVKRGSKWPGYIGSAVENIQQNTDQKIVTLFFDYTGYEKHPRIYQHHDNAKKLTELIKLEMGW